MPQANPPARRMTKSEETNLLRLGRLNKDGAIAAQKERTKTALAEFEMRLASQFSYDQRQAWADLVASAKAHTAALDQQLAADCRRLGIPEVSDRKSPFIGMAAARTPAKSGAPSFAVSRSPGSQHSRPQRSHGSRMDTDASRPLSYPPRSTATKPANCLPTCRLLSNSYPRSTISQSRKHCSRARRLPRCSGPRTIPA